jgi:hypothetical protein
VYAVNPTWSKMIESDVTKRLKQLLPSQGGFFEISERDDKSSEIEFPVLQPFKADSEGLYSLKPWTSSVAGVIFEVKFHDVLSLLPGSEYTLGEVCIPFSDLAKSGEMSGWFTVVGTSTDRQTSSSPPTDDSPQIFLRLRWIPPGEGNDRSHETEREVSSVIQEELMRSAIMSREQKFSVVGSSIDAFNSVRGIRGNLLWVQNTLAMALDTVESLRNTFNFSVSMASNLTESARNSILLTYVSYRIHTNHRSYFWL